MEREPRSADAIIEDFQQACLKTYDISADSSDPHLRLFPQAMYELCEEDPIVRDDIVDIFGSPKRENDKPERVLDLIIRAANTDRLQMRGGIVELKDPDYPGNLTTVEKCKDFLGPLFTADDGAFFYNVKFRDIQSNFEDRYKNLKLLPVLFPGELPEHPTFLDFGSSLNLGLKWLVRSQEFAPRPTAVYDGDFHNPDEDQIVLDGDRSRLMNDVYLPSIFVPGQSHGVDFWPMDDAGNILWASGCAYPGEFRNNARLNTLNNLRQEVPGVQFSGRVECQEEMTLERVLDHQKFDVVYVCMTLHMNSRENIAKILRNAERYARRYVAIFDVVDHDPNEEEDLVFSDVLYDQNRHFGFKFLVKDLQEPKKGFQELIRYSNGRCRSAMLNLSNLAVRESFKV